MATGKKAGSLAGKGLGKKSTSRSQKTVDGSDLAQVPKKAKKITKKK